MMILGFVGVGFLIHRRRYGASAAVFGRPFWWSAKGDAAAQDTVGCGVLLLKKSCSVSVTKCTVPSLPRLD
jgi:hypothetical protein